MSWTHGPGPTLTHLPSHFGSMSAWRAVGRSQVKNFSGSFSATCIFFCLGEGGVRGEDWHG